jgi:hypothetical protein
MIMSKNEKIEMARINWMKASDELGFKFISPYSVTEDNKEYVFFAFIPKYGSPKGTIIDLIFAPAYEMSNKTIEIANANGCLYSFINIDSIIDYNREYFLDIIEDWGKY